MLFVRSNTSFLARVVAAPLIGAVAAGCVAQSDPSPASETVALEPAANTTCVSSLYSHEVQQTASGQWQSHYSAPSGIRYGWFWDANVWADIAVKNIAPTKSVGVRWTADGWRTSHESRATFKKALDTTYEQWGVDLAPAASLQSCFWCTYVPPTVEYAIFYTVNGLTYWDNNSGQNYQVQLRGTYGDGKKLDVTRAASCDGGGLRIDPVAGSASGEFVATITDPKAIDYFLVKAREAHSETQELYAQPGVCRTYELHNVLPYNVAVSGEGAARKMTVTGLRSAPVGGYESGQFSGNFYLQGSDSLNFAIDNAQATSSHSMLIWRVGDFTFANCTAK